MVLILPSAAQEIRRRKLMGYSQKPTFQKALVVGGTYALTTKEKGKFGRFLGEFKTGKGFITKLLIKERLAVPYTGQNKKEIAAAQEANRLALVKEGKL
jgi:endonuclease YncB( thermonuclease family)